MLAAIGLIALGLYIGSDDTIRAPRRGQALANPALRGAEILPPAARATLPTATTAPAPPPAPIAPALRGALPVGKGMWLYMPKAVEGGDPNAIVAKANAIGLTHLFVRTGSSKTGFYAGDFLTPAAPGRPRRRHSHLRLGLPLLRQRHR